MNKERKAFNFLRSYYEVLKMLPDAESKSAYIEAICQKQFEGKEPILKGMENFAYVSQKHSIDKSRKGWEDIQKRSFTDAPKGHPMTHPMVGSTTHPMAHPIGKEKEQEKEQEKEKEEVKEKKEVFNFRKELINLGFEKELVEDWLKVRKTKKATNTKTALKSFINEIKKTNQDKNKILQLCVERSWSGFKASYFQNSINTSKTKNNSTSAIEKLRNEIFKTQDNGEYPSL